MKGQTWTEVAEQVGMTVARALRRSSGVVANGWRVPHVCSRITQP
jgi:hypothetical protein